MPRLAPNAAHTRWPSILAVMGLLTASSIMATETPTPKVEQDDGTLHVRAFDLPESALLSDETRAALKQLRAAQEEDKVAFKSCPTTEGAATADVPAIRKCQREAFYKTSSYKSLRDRYDVVIASQEIAGVHAEVFLPRAGVASKNRKRVLINVHGGGFVSGSRTASHLESIPIASVGQIKVISIDYRMAPEHSYPAATEDVAKVYRELSKDYKPGNIGLYGCSAGAVLAAQSVAWFQKEGLAPPGAVGLFCGAGAYWGEGDSGTIAAALYAYPADTSRDNAYLKNADPNDPVAFPIRSKAVLARFPPALLIASVRDPALSSVAHMHSRLVALGVPAELHVWEGLGHAFFFDHVLPESSEAFDVTVRFFDRVLGAK